MTRPTAHWANIPADREGHFRHYWALTWVEVDVVEYGFTGCADYNRRFDTWDVEVEGHASRSTPEGDPRCTWRVREVSRFPSLDDAKSWAHEVIFCEIEDLS